jgi:hypothetical protein
VIKNNIWKLLGLIFCGAHGLWAYGFRQCEIRNFEPVLDAVPYADDGRIITNHSQYYLRAGSAYYAFSSYDWEKCIVELDWQWQGGGRYYPSDLGVFPPNPNQVQCSELWVALELPHAVWYNTGQAVIGQVDEQGCLQANTYVRTYGYFDYGLLVQNTLITLESPLQNGAPNRFRVYNTATQKLMYEVPLELNPNSSSYIKSVKTIRYARGMYWVLDSALQRIAIFSDSGLQRVYDLSGLFTDSQQTIADMIVIPSGVGVVLSIIGREKVELWRISLF